MPTQIPSTGAATASRFATIGGTTDAIEAGHARRICADAGHDQPVGGNRRGRVVGDGDVGADAGQSSLGRAQVARPVVEHHDPLHNSHSTPLVEGTPWTRGSSSTAARSDRATALYCASVMWCQSRPLSTVTCRAMAAW